ncbi:MAG TPA: amino acid adenylation domain-containing protein [Actinophytocola sp.]|nr:amino acid adenylation domain-containing protein [Actinophytocola sp.]
MTVLDDIVTHATRRPHEPAVVGPDGELTYGELLARVDRLAGALAGLGVGPERVCAVAVEHGIDAVVGMAAVLRAGGAFLTLDVEQPVARLTDMVRSGRAEFLLTTAALAGRLPLGGPTVLVDDPAPAKAAAPVRPDPRSLAYVSHTSGSTGSPNAVLVEHRGFDAYLRTLVRDCGLGQDTVTVQLAPLGYDASIRDVFATLLAGGRLVVLSRATLMRPAELGAAVRRFGVDTILSVTPSFLTFLVRDGSGPAWLGDMRLVASSGESLRPLLAAGGRGLVGGRLVNQYGPTEATMTSTRFDVPTDPDTTVDKIGVPNEGVTAHVLDEALRLVPDGEVGEVYLGGAGVARGYHGRPGETAARFLADPFGAPGARMYRTGDLARRLPDGTLEYLGRIDRQLKIRGYRVDPAEIEGRLLAHPAVSGAVVTAAYDERGRAFLTAHVTGHLAELGDAALRAHLARTLPHHMMPRRFARLDQLPTTRTGKADRATLTLGGDR